MKKLLALLLALVMAFSVVCAGAEESELDAKLNEFFVNLINLNDHDVSMTMNYQGQAFNVKVGQTEKGFNALLDPLGGLMVGQDAAYLNFGGNTMAVKYETVTNVFKTMFSSAQASGGLSGLDFEKLSNAVMVLVSRSFGFIGGAMQAVNTEAIEGGTRMTFNAEALVNAINGFMDSLAADESAKNAINDLTGVLGMVGLQMDADQLFAAWDANKEMIGQLIKSLEITVDMLEDGKYEATVLIHAEPVVKILSVGSADAATGAFENTTTVAAEGEEPIMTAVLSFKDGVTEVNVSAPNMLLSEKIVTDAEKLISFDYNLNASGMAVEMHYTDDKFSGSFGELSFTCEAVAKEATREVFQVTLNNAGTEISGQVVIALEENVLTVSSDLEGMAFDVSLAAVEKGEYPDYAADENLQWVDENMLMSLFSSSMSMIQ